MWWVILWLGGIAGIVALLLWMLRSNDEDLRERL